MIPAEVGQMVTSESGLAKALSGYCREAMSLPDARVADFGLLARGWESDIYAFRLEAWDRTEDLVLRAYSGQGAEDKCAREGAVMRWVGGLGYPVPAIVAAETSTAFLGSPFILMERIEGEPLGPVMGKAPLTEKRRLIQLFCQMLVDLHALHWRPLLPELEGRLAPGSLERWLRRSQAWMHKLGWEASGPVLDWLWEHKGDAGAERLALIHGDYHPINVLYRADGAAFVIDWTQAEVNDFRLDLAWALLLMGTYDGWGIHEAVLREYERLAEVRVEAIEYFEVAAAARRLFSILASLSAGAEALGMRAGAEAHMRSNLRHLESVYTLLCYRTGLVLPEVEAQLDGLMG